MTNDVKGLESYNICHSADKCLFPVFEDCLIDGNYSGLGDAPKYIQEQAWQRIYSEYLQMIDDGSNAARLEQIGRIHSLSAKIDRIKSLCAHVLHISEMITDVEKMNEVAEPLFEALRESGYRVKRLEDLKRVIALIKSDESTLKMLINNLPENEDGGSVITRAQFDKNIIEIEAFMKMPVSKEKLTVSKYCGYVQRMRAHSEASKNKKAA